MNERFKIYIDRLKNGHVEKIAETFEPAFLDIHEPELAFRDEVVVEGKAYLANDNLVLHLNAATYGIMPCSVCNEGVKVELNVSDAYFTQSIDEIKSGIFDFSEILREAILLEVPQFAECCEGNCSQRKEISKYLKKHSEHQQIKHGDEEG